jgi:SAM-dependent methyltransferase
MENFFDKFPSPHPFDVQERISNGFREPYDLSKESRLIFPEKLNKSFKIKTALIIGSGHTEGIYHALRNPDITYTCIDISKKAIDASIKDANRLKLKNCTFIHANFLDFNKESSFDVIYSRNVFQYFPDAVEAFKKCFNLLSDDGAILCTLASSYLYEDIDYIRDVVLELGYSYNNSDDINEVINFITGLSGAHPSKLRAFNNDKILDEKDFISRFMSPVHNSFSIDDLFSTIDASGLFFQSWYNNNLYYPSALLRKESSKHPSFYDRINKLDLLKKWDAICRLLRASNDRYSHTFCLRKKKELEFYDLKLLNKNSSFASIRPYQVIKEIQGRSGYYAASSNYLKKLSEGEFKFLNYIKKPKTLDSFFKEKISNINSSDKKNIIQALNEASIIYLYE